MNEKEIIEALKLEDFTPIYNKAKEICQKEKGSEVLMRGIIEFSNICARECTYCGLNKNNNTIRRYEMEPVEIIETAYEAIDAGYKTIVLQSGETQTLSLENLGKVVREIKKKNVAVTISCGELPYESLKFLRECGGDRYLLKHETADPKIYGKLHPDSSLEKRVKCLKDIKEIGFETGSGFMIGLPGQRLETIAKDLLLLKEIPCDMAGIGPFIPHPKTPLRNEKQGSTELTKRAVAIARILLPKANLPVTTSLAVLDPEERKKAFSCGANIIMKKVTPNKYKDAYQIYPANIPEINIKKDREDIIKLLNSVGKKGV